MGFRDDLYIDHVFRKTQCRKFDLASKTLHKGKVNGFLKTNNSVGQNRIVELGM